MQKREVEEKQQLNHMRIRRKDAIKQSKPQSAPAGVGSLEGGVQGGGGLQQRSPTAPSSRSLPYSKGAKWGRAGLGKGEKEGVAGGANREKKVMAGKGLGGAVETRRPMMMGAGN